MADYEKAKYHLEQYKPYPFYINDDFDNRYVYGEILVEEINYTEVDEMTVYVSVSLFNENMIHQESEFLGNKNA